MKEYRIDYDMFTTAEIVKIFAFFALIESTKKRSVSPSLLVEKYQEYRTILNNKSLEKKYDKMLFTNTKVSIYETIKQAKEKLNHAP
ncbi:MAG TPA: UPF0223 family protein [Bacilli bacterium]|nr:MAG: hypothetical protein BWY97_01012 [Tenericutes bacterium ADurb.BinA124]HNZ50016.1 UPF0223 family protein [Bacilli bacterium]HPN60540.1 UPF0223 family protein [Bacilli bacterium]HPX84376.1 UPF0223 family protein [Bacilli bacterium]HQC73985.1 UPF0223 family protein [Bacilli bacterium]